MNVLLLLTESERDPPDLSITPLLAGRERLSYKYISLADVFATPRTDGIDLIGEGRLCEICTWPDLDCQVPCLTIIII